MILQIPSSSSTLLYLFTCFVALLLSTADSRQMRVGVLVDNASRMGVEIRTGAKVGAQELFHLHYMDPGNGDSLQIVRAAQVLVKEKRVEAIIGMTTWAETALVASVGSKARVPVLSFSGSVMGSRTMQHQWPFLVQMVPDLKQQIKCINDIVTSFSWRKVVVIYEVDSHGSDSGVYTMLSERLRLSSVEIEHRLVLPLYSSSPDPASFIHKEVSEMVSKKSRVFIVLKTSMAWGFRLFGEAKEQKLMDKHSAWIVSDPLAGLLDSVSNSGNSAMEGALGVTTFFSVRDREFQSFKKQFRRVIRADYPEEESSEPSIYALRALDSIMAIKEAVKRSSNSTDFVTKLLSSNFSGLSGLISFQGGEIIQPSLIKIVNVIGRKYRDLGYWKPDRGFSKSPYDDEAGRSLWENKMNKLSDSVYWPGDPKCAPKGWSMPNESHPLRIGVPGRTTFEKFVKVAPNASSNSDFTGYCIHIFNETKDIIEKNYPLPFKFIKFNGSYDELVQSVGNKTFDAAVGDITILAGRCKSVDFTQPYAESGLKLVAKENSQNQQWIFVKPFTNGMWGATGLILLYTVMIVWLLERQHNPEFGGSWWNQLNTSIWFTCCSFFFAHREKVQNTYTRVVILVWLFVVLSINSSYTASLSSLLTVPRLTPAVPSIQWLKDNNKTVGCDGDSFVKKYLVDVLDFKPDQIKTVPKEYDYPEEFKSGKISAAFLELPYQKAFFSEHCEGYTVVRNNSNFIGDRFGGLGFAFQRGSPFTEDFSRAILALSEKGRLKELELKYFSTSPACSKPNDGNRLDWKSFWGLYLFSAVISATCYLLFLLRQLYERWRWPQISVLNFSLMNQLLQNHLRWLV